MGKIKTGVKAVALLASLKSEPAIIPILFPTKAQHSIAKPI
jgi:hypothetical protein